jgi:RNA polymerase sigma factor (sigma-70 family)
MADVVQRLIDKRADFLAFLTRKVGDRELAEDLLQDAFARLDKLEQLRDDESAVAWFYRVLRNAVVDRARREHTRSAALEALAHERPAPEVEHAICQCIGALKDELKPSYRQALERVELAGLPVKDYAAQAGISANSAAVRLFRARGALRAQLQKACGACASHGCLDCTCRAPVSSL